LLTHTYCLLLNFSWSFFISLNLMKYSSNLSVKVCSCNITIYQTFILAHRPFELARKGFNVNISTVWPQVKCLLTCSAFELKAVDFFIQNWIQNTFIYHQTFSFFDPEIKRKLTRFQIISYIFFYTYEVFFLKCETPFICRFTVCL